MSNTYLRKIRHTSLHGLAQTVNVKLCQIGLHVQYMYIGSDIQGLAQTVNVKFIGLGLGNTHKTSSFANPAQVPVNVNVIIKHVCYLTMLHIFTKEKGLLFKRCQQFNFQVKCRKFPNSMSSIRFCGKKMHPNMIWKKITWEDCHGSLKLILYTDTFNGHHKTAHLSVGSIIPYFYSNSC